MKPFFPFLIAAFVAACAWTILELTIAQRKRRFLGVMGAWGATVVLAALWQAEAVLWLWAFLQGVLVVWYGSIALLIIAFVSTWRVKEPGRLLFLSCAAISLAANVAAVIQFLWLAMVRPGGV